MTQVQVPPSRTPEAVLRGAIKWYPLHELRLAIDAAQSSAEEAVDSSVMTEAQARVAQLATEDLVAAIRKRQLESLTAAVATAEEEGVVGEPVLEKARALVVELEGETPGAEPAPPGTHPMDVLERPPHIDPALLASVMHCADKTQAAVHGYEYWQGEISKIDTNLYLNYHLTHPNTTYRCRRAVAERPR